MATIPRNTAPSAAQPNRIDRLRIRHLRLLDLVARSGSLTAAAGSLHISQPAVTKMLQELEQAFGCTLIERTTRGGRLSAAGERALERLRIALGALDAAGEALATRPELPLVRIGVLPLVGVNVLPRLVAKLSRQGTLPRLQVREHTVSGLLAMLARGELDCAVGRLGTGDAEHAQAQGAQGLDIAPLWDEHLAIACAPDHPLARRREVSLAALHESPWILPPRGTHTREIFEQPFLDDGQLPPVPHIESMSFHTSLSMVAGSGFLAVVPDSAARHYGAMSMVRKVRLRAPFPSGRMVFITPRHAAAASSASPAITPAVALIARALREDAAA
ncbi:LysR family transcriptional regulator [Cupriavidus sp. 2TAF22]|uniref:LysR family transcriptional regulator n=1 Tax=unclassified Cupriavidus TaxID=2640874 RepID=UPI003F92759E